MNKIRNSTYFIFSCVVSLILFIPNLIKSTIGSDWDSYALIGTFYNYDLVGLYTPSRPPGFPIYELIIGIIFKVLRKGSLLSPEQGLLIFQFFLVIILNFIVYRFINKSDQKNYLFYLLIVFSPMYLISGGSVIDYFLGAIFGFLAIYMVLHKYSSNYIYAYLAVLLSLSIGIRLSNAIFLIAILLYITIYKKNYTLSIYTAVLTMLLSCFIYLPFYANLYSFYTVNNIYNSPSEMICLLNLTNTDHTFIDRLGRFVLKQINFFGVIGFVLFLMLIKNARTKITENNFIFFIIFILFQFSFLRLPTEEGHLLPAFISLLLVFSNMKNFNSKILIATLTFTFLSNFVDFKFYSVNSIDSASDISLNASVTKGFFIEDYELRNNIALEKEFHYKNSQSTLFDAWKNGCPN
jgi:hypothetical protein